MKKIATADKSKLIIEGRPDFRLIPVSKLTLSDEFMNHEPKTIEERIFKERLIKAINNGLNDFWKSIYDPSFNKTYTGIVYEPGRKPAVGKSYEWWEKIAKEFMPEYNSRLGRDDEYVAFWGQFIKDLILNGWSVDAAWDVICNNSKHMGHFADSEDAKQEPEPTGSRERCGFFDLGNTDKILLKNKAGKYGLAGGDYYYNGSFNTLSGIIYFKKEEKLANERGVGWIVLEV